MEEDKRCGNCIHKQVKYGAYPCGDGMRIGGGSASNCPYWARKPTPPKPKGIDIVMMCGEKHHIDTVQPEIKTVTLNGEQVYPQEDTPKATHIDKPKTAGGTREGCYDLITRGDYYLESRGSGDHIDVKDKNGNSVATLCAHAFTPKTRIYS